MASSRLRLGAGERLRGERQLHQFRVEDLFLGRGVDFEEHRQPGPDVGQRRDAGGIHLLQQGEATALLVMVVQDQLRDVHGVSWHGELSPSHVTPRRTLQPHLTAGRSEAGE